MYTNPKNRSKQMSKPNYQCLTGRPTMKEIGITLWLIKQQWPWFHPVFVNLDLHRKDFKNRQFNRTAIDNCNCSAADFTDADLSYCYIVDTDFAGANLNHTNFYGAEVIGCNFTGANMQGTNFARSIRIHNRGLKDDG